MKLFRIADTRHTIWSGTGAMLVGGRRWIPIVSTRDWLNNFAVGLVPRNCDKVFRRRHSRDGV
ncbi:hypothetical protein A8E25_03055 [Burkholderia cenocepacia]|nr:hypothetical protein A8E17_38660 [Burkholderia cenocepacia]ONR74573.1 hypothetical protein A8E22_27350 [Burkholderia cenocepacia]ONR78165.1 hypothetical protein A8E23_02855 [Burkholderia cenocepacia]ONR78781.1 hypothetical protein A8E18_04125 [Burkholderia cenocepacia]ONR85048.1 hypothetical protein A8E19_32560 [Burkholderia cenocepacia]